MKWKQAAPQDPLLGRKTVHNDRKDDKQQVDKMGRLGTAESQVVLVEKEEETEGWRGEEQVLAEHRGNTNPLDIEKGQQVIWKLDVDNFPPLS